jgi:tRNA A-37 threonylcarbamoyl transferase component Bud32
MREIDELIKNVKRYNDTIVQEKFKSKKNTVAYVTMDNNPRVLKMFVSGLRKQMKNEYTILKKGSNKINIPSAYELDEENNILIMNYILGENLCDLLNSENTSFSEKNRIILLLSDWFINFHNFFKTEDRFMIRGDSSLRNFIFTDRIWGVDFEEARFGKPVEDIAEMCSSILTTDPMFTEEKFILCKNFIDSYLKKAPGRILHINDEIAYSILEKIQWRPNEEDILRKYSKKIKDNGLV